MKRIGDGGLGETYGKRRVNLVIVDIVRNVLDDLVRGGPDGRVDGVGGGSGGAHAEGTGSEEVGPGIARSSGLSSRRRGSEGGGSADDSRDSSACNSAGKGGL